MPRVQKQESEQMTLHLFSVGSPFLRLTVPSQKKVKNHNPTAEEKGYSVGSNQEERLDSPCVLRDGMGHLDPSEIL